MIKFLDILFHTRITCWTRWHKPKDGKSGYWQFNHICDGWQEGEQPIPWRVWAYDSPPAHKAWAAYKWKKEHAILSRFTKKVYYLK